MPCDQRYEVQVFEHRESCLIVGARLSAGSCAQALMIADDAAELFGGAVALQLKVDAGTGGAFGPEILAKIGAVPDGWAEGLLANPGQMRQSARGRTSRAADGRTDPPTG